MEFHPLKVRTVPMWINCLQLCHEPGIVAFAKTDQWSIEWNHVPFIVRTYLLGNGLKFLAKQGCKQSLVLVNMHWSQIHKSVDFHVCFPEHLCIEISSLIGLYMNLYEICVIQFARNWIISFHLLAYIEKVMYHRSQIWSTWCCFDNK